MPLIKASRPALQQTLAVTAPSQIRPLSISTPARLANKSRVQIPRGYLAEKGPFPFQQRATSYEELMERRTSSSSSESGSELAMLRRQAVEQKRKIEVLQGTISDLLANEWSLESSV
ncbi:hypothetical protein BJX76DRAFT_325750 [Aspergillus varians]